MATAFASMPYLDTVAGGMPGGDSEAGRLLARHAELVQQRTLYDHVWQDQLELMLPGAADITHYRTPGSTRTDRLFDTTAILASQTLAANIMGAVTNQAITWATLTFREPLLK